MNTIRDSLHMDKPAVLRSDLRRDNLILLKKDVTCNKKTLEERLEFRIKKHIAFFSTIRMAMMMLSLPALSRKRKSSHPRLRKR